MLGFLSLSHLGWDLTTWKISFWLLGVTVHDHTPIFYSQRAGMVRGYHSVFESALPEQTLHGRSHANRYGKCRFSAVLAEMYVPAVSMQSEEACLYTGDSRTFLRTNVFSCGDSASLASWEYFQQVSERLQDPLHWQAQTPTTLRQTSNPYLHQSLNLTP